MDDLNKLYSPVIKAHQAHPYHFQKMKDVVNVKAYNPICGDKFEFYPEIDENKIISFHFHGYGCAVSMAAGSVLVKALEGRSIPDAITLCNAYLDLLHDKEADNLPPDFYSFKGVRDFPARFDCASIACVAIKNYLEKKFTR